MEHTPPIFLFFSGKERENPSIISLQVNFPPERLISALSFINDSVSKIEPQFQQT